MDVVKNGWALRGGEVSFFDRLPRGDLGAKGDVFDILGCVQGVHVGLGEADLPLR